MKKIIFTLIVILSSQFLFSQCSVGVSSTSVTCNTLCNGTAVANAVGTGSISYSWSPGSFSTQHISALCAGTYTVNITDSIGCTTHTTVVINEPSALSATITPIGITCYGAKNGQAVASVSGGTPNYFFLWSTLPIETSPVAINLDATTYSVTITDMNSCTLLKTVTLVDPPLINVTIATTASVTCYGGTDGAASITLSGGLPYSNGYKYSWSPDGQTTNSAANLTATTHTIEIRDSLNCVRDTFVTIAGPAPFVVDAYQTGFCGNGNSGVATVSVTGGAPIYFYQWISTGQFTQIATGLAPGTYSVFVIDSRSCFASDTLNVMLYPELTATLTSTDIDCNGNQNGSVSSSVSGGGNSYSYLWLPSNSTTTAISGLSAGTYTLHVSDTLGCFAKQTATIAEPSILTLSISHSSITCGSNSTASATAVAIGGNTGAFSYLWMPVNQTTASVSGLAASTYTCGVMDSKGCVAAKTITISVSSPVSASATAIDVSCFGSSDGQIQATQSGGVAPYSYLWNNNSMYTTQAVSGLVAGSYTITVTDSLGCFGIATTTVNQPTAITFSSTVSNASTVGGSDAAIALSSISGGNGQFTFLWSTNDTTASVTGLSAGTYSVCIADAKGCDTCTTFIVTEPGMGITNSIAEQTTIYPVPFSNELTIRATSALIDRIEILDMHGKLVYTNTYPTNGMEIKLDTKNYENGIYTLLIHSSKNNFSRKIVKISQ
ncbi:MAG: T9SS type A sorting domain-containing protein [Bacteroidetes bacterium]|nr:T9SS type A sorting domain-containing protein [Bacteroidota bacterium]